MPETLDLSQMQCIIEIPFGGAIHFEPLKTGKQLEFTILKRDLSVKDRFLRYEQPVSYDYENEIFTYGEKTVDIDKQITFCSNEANITNT